MFKRCIIRYLGQFFAFGLLGIAHMGVAQLSATVYETFTQTWANPYLINPAASDSSYSFNASFNNISELGLLKNVNRFYFDGDKKFSSTRKNEYHFIGIQTTNSKLGDYISKSQLQMRYSWYAQMSKKTFFSAGIAMGFINYAFLTTQGGTGGSDYAPDGSIGVHLMRSGLTVGLALQQIFTPVLIPVNQSFQLSRLYNLDVTKQFQLTSGLDVSMYSVMQVSDKGIYSYSMGMMSTIADLGLIGINNHFLRKTTASVGLKRLELYGMGFTIMAAYSYYHSEIAVADNTIEFFVAIQK